MKRLTGNLDMEHSKSFSFFFKWEAEIPLFVFRAIEDHEQCSNGEDGFREDALYPAFLGDTSCCTEQIQLQRLTLCVPGEYTDVDDDICRFHQGFLGLPHSPWPRLLLLPKSTKQTAANAAFPRLLFTMS
ncbi:hypothetical protein CB1_056579056 [Camelus ferus]|nr:hypothetical protein CB1_056579056 [Camelus ferus]